MHKKFGIAGLQLRFFILCLGLSSFILAACGEVTNTLAPTTAAPTTAAITTALSTTAANTTAPLATTLTPTTAATTATTASGEVIVFAASSLTDAFNDIKGQLEKANPNLKITINYGASSALRTQLEQGAKADVFASADQPQMDNAVKAGLVEGKGTVFVRNRLVVIVAKNNPGKVAKLQDLANSGLKFVTAQKEVPIGAYTLDALDKMSKDTAFGTDFSAKVQANIVSREANVKQVVSKVQLGEADAAIVYATDVTASIAGQLTTLDIPDQFNTIASYPISPLKAASNVTGAKFFVDYLLSAAGQATLHKYNFITSVTSSR